MIFERKIQIKGINMNNNIYNVLIYADFGTCNLEHTTLRMQKGILELSTYKIAFAFFSGGLTEICVLEATRRWYVMLHICQVV
jgi:hypothetical protein